MESSAEMMDGYGNFVCNHSVLQKYAGEICICGNMPAKSTLLPIAQLTKLIRNCFG